VGTDYSPAPPSLLSKESGRSSHYRASSTTLCSCSTTSVLTATTLIYAIGAGITAAAGTRLALQSLLVIFFTFYSFQLQNPKGSILLFTVTTSLYQDWVICAPAAFLGSGSHFSGSLSGIEPQFPVTRYHHGRPLSYHRKLIGQKFE
jgi:hypothetical protein